MLGMIEGKSDTSTSPTILQIGLHIHGICHPVDGGWCPSNGSGHTHDHIRNYGNEGATRALAAVNHLQRKGFNQYPAYNPILPTTH